MILIVNNLHLLLHSESIFIFCCDARNKLLYHEKCFEEEYTVVPLRNKQRGGTSANLNPRIQHINANTIHFAFSRLQPSGALPATVVWKLRQLQIIAKNTKLKRK